MAHRCKDWQFNLRFNYPYSLLLNTHLSMPRANISSFGASYDVEGVSMREGILEAVAELAKVEDLRSLKIKFPCLCQAYSSGSEINLHNIGAAQLWSQKISNLWKLYVFKAS